MNLHVTRKWENVACSCCVSHLVPYDSEECFPSEGRIFALKETKEYNKFVSVNSVQSILYSALALIEFFMKR